MSILSNDKLHQIVSKIGLIKQEVLDTALQKANESGGNLATILIKQDLIKPQEVGQLVANTLHLKYVNLAKENIAPEVLTLIPEIVARKQWVIAYRRDEKGLWVATSDPFNYPIIKSLEKKVGEPVIANFSTEYELENVFGLYRKSIQEEYATKIQKNAIRAQGTKAEDVSVVSLVDDLLRYGFTNHASDIHIEPGQKDVKVRFRIDGILYDILTLPRTILELVVARVKILAKLRTDETRSAQDGKIVTTVQGDKLDIRVSIVPITNGEKVVMRLLSAQGQSYNLEDLGMGKEDLDIVKDASIKPYGMILVTGPTGSGKTTTLYAVVKILNKRDVNICTIEDPVEYDLTGVNQIQVNPATNLTFAAGLKSLLRQDPDIIMVGEIRDKETAGIAVNSAMTGHLVLSTLHTNDAATALPRLLDMNVEPFLIASTVHIVVAQRLLRRICLKCIYSYTLEQSQLDDLKQMIDISKFLNTKEMSEIRLYKGRGCASCNNSGYVGRVGIFEILQMTENIKKLIMSRGTADDIKKQARLNGMTTMMEDGFRKAVQGQTTLDEIFRVTK